ncbi:hypothetical protein NIES204_05950 [Planktothrix agardhii NIES-204]|nr:hypothetical protein NIES204_05950 [Planktothrix agardhii NIES-204]
MWLLPYLQIFYFFHKFTKIIKFNLQKFNCLNSIHQVYMLNLSYQNCG